jgi:hypothetical protein
MKTPPALFLAVVVATAPLAAQPVSDPDGRVTGFVGETEIDLPVACVGDPVAVARSHEGDGIPAVTIGLPNGPSRFGSVDARTPEGEFFFSAERVTDGFPTVFEGEADGVSFRVEIDCPSPD